MLGKHLISVLIPVQNTSKYLRKCLDSIVSQTYRNLQITIAENDSSDTSEAICREYSKRFSNIECIAVPRKGISEVRQALLNQAKGEYIIFIDSDDWIDPQMIEDLYKLAFENNLDFISSQITTKNIYNKELTRNKELRILNRTQAVDEFFSKKIIPSLCVKLVSSKIYRKVSFNPDIYMAEDYYMTWKLINQSNRIGYIQASYYHYVDNPSSVTHLNNLHTLQTSLIACDEIVKDCKIYWPKYLKNAQHVKAISALKLVYYAIRNKQEDKEKIHIWLLILKNYIDQYKSLHPATFSLRLFSYMIRKHYDFSRFIIVVSRHFFRLIPGYRC